MKLTPGSVGPSTLAMREGKLPPVLNYKTADPDCGIAVATDGSSPGRSFLNLSVTPQGQAAVLYVAVADPAAFQRLDRAAFQLQVAGAVMVQLHQLEAGRTDIDTQQRGGLAAE